MDAEFVSRRSFLQGSTAVAAGATLASMASSAPTLGANEKFVVTLVGCGGRNSHLVDELLDNRKDVEIAYVCDPDHGRMARLAQNIGKKQGRRPKEVEDYRKTLDDKAVHAIFNATPDHWHVLPVIHACQAGKDAYYEKPMSHNIWEGRQLVNAAAKYRRIVQMGNQNRSAPYNMKAVEYIRSGKLGSVHLCKVFNMKHRRSIGKKPDCDPPPGVNYDRWLGPAPERTFSPNRFHYDWHWYWDYSGGDIINDGVHQVDLARWLLGVGYPKSVFATGGQHFHDDDQETPDTQVVTYDFDKLTMVFELTLWTPYMAKTPWDFRNTDGFPPWLQNATRIEVYGSKGMMMIGRHGGGWQVFGPNMKEIAQCPGRRPLARHLENFFRCVKSRKTPNAEPLGAHQSTILCHLANYAYRVGAKKLVFDAKTETITNCPEAQKLAKRTGRKGYEIPEIAAVA